MARLRRPLRQVGRKAQEWKRWRDTNYGLLALRVRGRCEGCKQERPLDPHHVIGRDDEPWSSIVQLLAGLCRICHNGTTGQLGSGIDWELRERLEKEAANRLEKFLGRVESEVADDWRRYIESQLLPELARLYEYDPDHSRIHRRAA